MSIAAARRRRRQQQIGNRHLAKIGRPGVPAKVSAEKSATRLARHIEKMKTIASNKGKKRLGD